MTPGPLAGTSGARPAQPGDVAVLEGLYQAATSELRPMRGGRLLLGLDGRQAPLGESFHQQLQDPGQAVVMGLLSGEAVGYGTCALRTVSDGGLLGVVGELFVQERARRAGVGRAMMEALVSWSQAHGASGMDASALPGSRAVKSFFEAGGFTARLLVMHRPLN